MSKPYLLLKCLFRQEHLLIQAVCWMSVLFLVVLMVSEYRARSQARSVLASYQRVKTTGMAVDELHGIVLQNLQNHMTRGELKELNNQPRVNGSQNSQHIQVYSATNDSLMASTLEGHVAVYLSSERVTDKFSDWIPQPEQMSVAFTQTPFLIANKQVCSNPPNYKTVILVHTAIDYFQRRQGIRQTWGSADELNKFKAKIVFLFGLPENETKQKLINRESAKFKDIVQGNFKDTYHNLTHKTTVALRWIKDYCNTTKYVIKVDDDVFLNTRRLQNKIDTLVNDLEGIYCKRQDANTSVIQRNEGKWKVKDTELKSFSLYPLPYCHGFFAMMSTDMAIRLYSAAKNVPFFWIDDFYLFGMVANKIGLSANDLNNLDKELSLHTMNSLVCFSASDRQCNLLAGNAPSFEFMKLIWEKMTVQRRLTHGKG